MPLPSPRLDDRTFEQLMEEARRHVRRLSPSWTDLSPGEPGTTILEVFAYLTETLLYRVNRVPEKAYVEYLRLIGVTLDPPAAATVSLRFSRERPSSRSVTIPRGTRVTVDGSAEGAPTFSTLRAATIAEDETEVHVRAVAAELVEAELAGTGTGEAGQTVVARRPPIIRPTGDDLDLVVAVEADDATLGEMERAIEYDGRAFRVWREVEHFVEREDENPYVYVCDRASGSVTFAPRVRIRETTGELQPLPEALAASVEAGREIRLWYRVGGGPEGNVAANMLTTLKDSIPGVAVTNPEPASGGRAGETIENALLRGPQELHSLRRTVTARDYELVATRSSGAVSRARAFTRAEVWAHAAPGTVEVVLVPELADPEKATLEALRSRQAAEALERIRRELDHRRPLGTGCVVSWARYKPVSVAARIVVYREEDPDAVRGRVLQRLHKLVNPLPTDVGGGWRFGEALRASHLYEMMLAEPGVSYVDGVRMTVAESPGSDVTSLSLDRHQMSWAGGVSEPKRTWYAGSGNGVFRSLDDGAGWESVITFGDEPVTWVGSHPEVPGLLAVLTSVPDASSAGEASTAIHLSCDSGESWQRHGRLGFKVADAEWISRDGVAVLLLASAVGLYEVPADNPNPIQVQVDPDHADLGFFSITAARTAGGGLTVALGSEAKRGVYLSHRGGASGSFQHSGLEGRWVRSLAVQYAGPITYVWAGIGVDGPEDQGEGCARFRLGLAGQEAEAAGAEEWTLYEEGWRGGSCYSLAVVGSQILAGTHRAGLLTLEASETAPSWKAPDLDCDLPLRDVGRFHVIETVAASSGVILVGGARGVFKSVDGGTTYTETSGRVFDQTVTIPRTWLLCSGEHDLRVVSEDEAEARTEGDE